MGEDVAMWRSWLAGAGLFVLGVLATMIIETLTNQSVSAVLRQRFKRKAAKELEQLTRDDDLIRLGDECLYIHQFVPGGYERRNISLGLRGERPFVEAIAEADPDLLPVPAESLIAEVEARRALYDSDEHPTWNGDTVTVENIDSFIRDDVNESPVLRLVVSKGDYATSQVCTERWQQWGRRTGSGHASGQAGAVQRRARTAQLHRPERHARHRRRQACPGQTQPEDEQRTFRLAHLRQRRDAARGLRA